MCCIVNNVAPIIRKSNKRILDDDDDEDNHGERDTNSNNNANSLEAENGSNFHQAIAESEGIVSSSAAGLQLNQNSAVIVPIKPIASNNSDDANTTGTNTNTNWTCKLCTFINTSKSRCRMCG